MIFLSTVCTVLYAVLDNFVLTVFIYSDGSAPVTDELNFCFEGKKGSWG